jgi:hypothetical protein
MLSHFIMDYSFPFGMHDVIGIQSDWKNLTSFV